VLVAPDEQVYPFRQLVGVGAVLVVGAWLFAFVPVLVQQHDVEGVTGGYSKLMFFVLKSFPIRKVLIYPIA
jgi:hypothetical protein